MLAISASFDVSSPWGSISRSEPTVAADSSAVGRAELHGSAGDRAGGSAAEAVEELWSATDAAGGAKGGAAAQLQRGRNLEAREHPPTEFHAAALRNSL